MHTSHSLLYCVLLLLLLVYFGAYRQTQSAASVCILRNVCGHKVGRRFGVLTFFKHTNAAEDAKNASPNQQKLFFYFRIFRGQTEPNSQVESYYLSKEQLSFLFAEIADCKQFGV